MAIRLLLWTAALFVALTAGPAAADEIRLTARQLLAAAASENVALSNGGVIELARGVLYEDDGPAAGYCYGPNEERLSGQVAIKKELLIDRPEAAKAYLLVAPGGELTAMLNGQPTTLKSAGKTGQYWQRYEFDPALLTAGKNEFVLGGSGKIWIAKDADFAAGSLTRRTHPNRSAKSSDGGRTWSYDRLGTGGDLDGEYYVRVFLDQVLPQGSLTLDVLDAANLGGGAVAPALKSIGPIRLTAHGSGNLGLQIRSGTTFVPADRTWSDWQPIAGQSATVERPAGRYFQVRIALCANDPLDSPRLEALTIRTATEVGSTWQSKVKVVDSRNSAVVRSAIPFAYEPLDQPRLKSLREQWNLDEVVRGAKRELELIGKLAVWSSQRWEKGHLGQHYPPWDAHEILKAASDGTPVGGFCQQYNVVFLQACESMGFVGRAVSLGGGDSDLATGKFRSGHEVVEIWSNEFAKWMYVDGNAAWYFTDEASGMPLSLLELRERQIAALTGKQSEETQTQIHRLGPSKYDWTGLTNWPPFLELRLIPRSNFLDQAVPLPLNQGMRGWFWTGHHVWTDERSPAALLYGNCVSQRRNWEWTLNQAHLTLTATETPGEIQVELDCVTPSLEGYYAQFDSQPLRRTGSPFRWQLHSGKNRLEVFPKNVAGREGVRSWIVLENPDG